jgi:hypothetical protein
MTTSEATEAIVRVMSPHIGETMARSATEAHVRKLGLAGGTPTPEQLEALLGKLGSGLNIFLGREKAAAVVAQARQALAAQEGSR